MSYTVYSYEIIDGDIDFIERIKEEGKREEIEEAFKLSHNLDKEYSKEKEKKGLLGYIVHLVYDENDERIDGYPGLSRAREKWA